MTCAGSSMWLTTRNPSSGETTSPPEIRVQTTVLCLYCREMLSDAIDRLGGYQADLWSGGQTLSERLNTIHTKVPVEEFHLETAQDRLQCLKINKIQELVVSEKTNMRDLNIAVLMTHWDYIAPVYFHRSAQCDGTVPAPGLLTVSSQGKHSDDAPEMEERDT